MSSPVCPLYLAEDSFLAGSFVIGLPVVVGPVLGRILSLGASVVLCMTIGVVVGARVVVETANDVVGFLLRSNLGTRAPLLTTISKSVSLRNLITFVTLVVGAKLV